MGKTRADKKNKPVSPRIHKVTFLLNDEEQKAVAYYLRKYKIANKSRWYRETILSHVLKVLVEEDYPTLFKESEMRR